nr:DUF4114 domain-containing protein [Neoroseomonas terrae]
MGSDFTLSVVGGRAAYDNALGWFEIRADGSFGDARFLSVTGGTTEIDGLGAGSRLALFLVSNGAALNDDLTGSFRFVDAVSGGAAKIGSKAPALVSVDRAGQVVEGNIFHTADANSFDMLNALNPTGHHQTLSRMDASGDLLIAFEDTLLTDGDFDFNDLVVKVTVHEDAGLL